MSPNPNVPLLIYSLPNAQIVGNLSREPVGGLSASLVVEGLKGQRDGSEII